MLPDKRYFDSFFKSAFTVDNVIFGFDEGKLKILLIRRNEEPYADYWALPGYFVQQYEDLDAAAERVLREMTGMENVYLEQLHTFGTPYRHAFGRVITVAYYSLVKIADFRPRAAGVAQDITWHLIDELGVLAFDHLEIVQVALEHLKKSIRTRPIGFELLPPAFTLTELQHLYESVWGTELEKRNFRKKILSMDLLRDVGKVQKGVAHRPAKLYRFDEQRYRELEKEGFNFEVRDGGKK
ncbi:NUDIX domain-containing protein [Neolewinella lacunae]|uniref:NUDIX hydrolase n=1 Tax=Neolewinella lacunae TaxID=1517758 RepID=A0A923TB41_9BACT|nr:NUDIX domain-containing protein [Neolewinella lacunae]MBC6996838.1 NUDIX hydrolase [Neolewinella lacunae]MDN3633816.1 NUDIX domain-containing protein [Neolewinella lacunae]